MEIEFELTYNDLAAFTRYQVQYAPLHKVMYQIMYFGISLTLFAFGVFVIFLPTSEKSWLLGISLLVLGVASLFVIPIWYRHKFDKWTEQAIKEQMKTGQYVAELKRQTISISNRGLVKITATNEWYWTWSEINRIEQNDFYFFIFFSPNLGSEYAHIIPKCAFTNEEEITKFHDAAKKFLTRG